MSFVTLRGEPYLLWRPINGHGAELGILLQKRRDKAAAKRFFLRVLRSCSVHRKIVTDQLRSYTAAKADIPDLANFRHVFVKVAARLNNRAGNSHQPIRERERPMRGFRDWKRTRACLSSFGPIRQHFALNRHLLRAPVYRKHLAARFAAWHQFTEVTQNPSTAFRAVVMPATVSPRTQKLTVPIERKQLFQQCCAVERILQCVKVGVASENGK